MNSTQHDTTSESRREAGEPGPERLPAVGVLPVEPEQPKARIMRAATQLFLRHGYDGTSVASIAREASMTPANLYWHFPNKERLLKEVLVQLFGEFVDEMVAASRPGRPAVERLRDLAAAYIRMQLVESVENKNFGYQSLASSLGEACRDELRGFQRVFIHHIKGILSQGVDEGDFHLPDLTLTAFAISTCCEYVFTWYQPSGRLTVDEVAGLYSDLVIAMATGQPGVRPTAS